MRWDSPFVLAIAGTIAIHTLILTLADIILVTNPYIPSLPAPKVQLVNVKVQKRVEKPKPPPPVQARIPDVPAPKDPRPRPRTVAPRQVQETPQPPRSETPPTPSTESTGGAPVIAMPDVTPSATGVPVAKGKRTTGAVGKRGSGKGTGAAEGSGSAPPDKPVSVATIKTRALPKGDYSYIADYPAEARRLGLEGPIRVRLVVDEGGKVKSAVLLNKLGGGLDELALEQAKKIEFDPAKDTDDQPVTSVVVWTFNMTLPK